MRIPIFMSCFVLETKDLPFYPPNRMFLLKYIVRRLLWGSASCLLKCSLFVFSRAAMTLPAWATAMEVCPALRPARSLAIKWRRSEVRHSTRLCRWHGSVNGLFSVLPPGLLHPWQVSLPGCLARCRPPWSWRLRNKKKTRCTITSLMINQMTRATEGTWGLLGEASAQGR